MPRSDRELIETVLGATFAGRFDDLLDLLSEDFFAHTSRGHVYVGHQGFSRWVRDTIATYSRREFEPDQIRELGDGFVLVAGTVRRELVDGGEEAQPGAWLIHVRAERLTSVVFFRTAEAALRAVAPQRADDPLKVIDAVIDAFNRGDHVAMLGAISPDYTFVSPNAAGERSGFADVAEMMVALRERYSDYVIESYEPHPLGGSFVAVDTVTRATAGERTTRIRRVWLLRIADGLLQDADFYDDLDAATSAARLRLGADDPG